jgi:hypothetical protein
VETSIFGAKSTQGDFLILDPLTQSIVYHTAWDCHRLASGLDGFAFGASHYKINMETPRNIKRDIRQVLLDGNPPPGSLIPLVEDGQPRDARGVMG